MALFSRHIIIKQYKRSTTGGSQRKEKPTVAGVRAVQENFTRMTTVLTQLEGQ